MAKLDWHHQVENERIPKDEVYETNDGNTIRIEYREENGTIYKTTKTYRNKKLTVLAAVAERKKWKKFGDAASDPPGINTATTKVDDEIIMQFLLQSDEEKQEELKLIQHVVSTLPKVKCRLCKGDHWTAKCPNKEALQSLLDEMTETSTENTPATPASTTTTQAPSLSTGATAEPSTNKWISVSARRAAADAQNTGNRPGPSRGSGYGGRGSDMRNKDEATVRVTNLPEETQEQDLRDLFTPFGPVSRIFLAKDKTSNTSKGYAFVTFVEKHHAQRAIDCISGYGYNHLILKVEWSK